MEINAKMTILLEFCVKITFLGSVLGDPIAQTSRDISITLSLQKTTNFEFYQTHEQSLKILQTKRQFVTDVVKRVTNL